MDEDNDIQETIYSPEKTFHEIDESNINFSSNEKGNYTDKNYSHVNNAALNIHSNFVKADHKNNSNCIQQIKNIVADEKTKSNQVQKIERFKQNQLMSQKEDHFFNSFDISSEQKENHNIQNCQNINKTDQKLNQPEFKRNAETITQNNNHKGIEQLQMELSHSQHFSYSQGFDAPIQLFAFDQNEKIQVNAQALELIHSIQTKKIGVICIAGPYRTGKSYLLNRFRNAQKGFQLGSSTNACTKGVWIWGKPILISEDFSVLLMDTEGLNSFDKDESLDTKLFLLSTLLSSSLIYNLMGNIDGMALEQLSFVTNLSKQINNSNSNEQNFNSQQYFPALYFAVRDFCLDIHKESAIQQSSNNGNENEYLEDCLSRKSIDKEMQSSMYSVKGAFSNIDLQNNVRNAIKENFRIRKCFTLVRPVGEEEKLRDLDNQPYESLRAIFRLQLEQLIHCVKSDIQPKMINQMPITPLQFVQIIQDYTAMLNSQNFIDVKSVAERTVDSVFQQTIKQIQIFIDQVCDIAIAQSNSQPFGEEQLALIQQHLQSMVEEKFVSSFQMSEQKQAQIRMKIAPQMIQEKVTMLRQNMHSQSLKFNSNISNRLIAQMIQEMVQLKNTTDFQAFYKIYQENKKKYVENCKGTAAFEVFHSQFFEGIFRITEKIMNNQLLEHQNEKQVIEKEMALLQSRCDTIKSLSQSDQEKSIDVISSLNEQIQIMKIQFEKEKSQMKEQFNQIALESRKDEALLLENQKQRQLLIELQAQNEEIRKQSQTHHSLEEVGQLESKDKINWICENLKTILDTSASSQQNQNSQQHQNEEQNMISQQAQQILSAKNLQQMNETMQQVRDQLLKSVQEQSLIQQQQYDSFLSSQQNFNSQKGSQKGSTQNNNSTQNQMNSSEGLLNAHELFYGIGRPKNTRQAMKLYAKEAEKGSTVALNMLGQQYADGVVVSQDIGKAFSSYKKSAAKNDPEGWYRIGQMIENGLLDTDKTVEAQLQQDKLNVSHYDEIQNSAIPKIYRAMLCYEKAANQGHLDALTDLGFIYEKGVMNNNNTNNININNNTNWVVEPDWQKAKVYYSKAKKDEHPRALNNLGKAYLLNQSIKEKVKGQNTAKAIRYFEKAHGAGCLRGTLNLGICYERGYGVVKSLDKAKLLFKDACEKGDIDGKFFYSIYLLRDGSITDSQEDFLQAALYFQEIVRLEPERGEANYYLGYLYENGLGVGQDYQVSLNYYKKAAQAVPPNSSAINKVGDFYNLGYGVKQNRNIAFTYYQQAAELNNPKALKNLGQMYEEGFDASNEDNAQSQDYIQQASVLRRKLIAEQKQFEKQDLHLIKISDKNEYLKQGAIMNCINEAQFMQNIIGTASISKSNKREL